MPLVTDGLLGGVLVCGGLLGSEAPAPGGDVRSRAVLARRVATVYGTPVPERAAALRAAAGTRPTLRWTLVDRDGLAVDLSAAAVAGVVPLRLRLREAVADAAGLASYEAAGRAIDPAGGVCEADVDVTALGGPGIYVAELAVMDDAGDAARPLFTNTFYLAVEPGLYGAGAGPAGPPSMAEIRLQLRDSSPGEHRLLDTVTFDDAELALAIARPVLYWNEALPHTDRRYTTADFPHRYHWVEAAVAVLFRMLAEYYRKNHLPLQAGGVAVDDLGKADDYEAAADRRWQEWVAWVRSAKVQEVNRAGWGHAGSAYGWGWGA